MKLTQLRCIPRALLLGIYLMISANARAQTKSNDVFLGPSVIMEDGYKAYYTYGLNAAYTHQLSRSLGITADGGGWAGSVSGTKYFHGELMGGISLFVPHSGKNAFTPYLLGGVSYMHSKYSYAGMDYTFSGTNATAAIGASYRFPINNKLGLELKADYNPAFGKGIVDNNIRVGLGIDIGDHPHTVSKPVYGGTPGGDTTRERPGTGTSVKTGNPSDTVNVAITNDGGHNNNYHTQFGEPCEASKSTKEVKISFKKMVDILKFVEDALNKVPRVEAKFSVKATATAKSGEECCVKTEPPVGYLEVKAGLEASAEINITVVGIPDIKYSVRLWPALLVMKIQAKITVGPTGKMNVEAIGRLYGALEHPINNENCPSCIYLSVKDECFIKVAVKAGAEAEVFMWAPENAGYDFEDVGEDGKPYKIGISAEASVSIGGGFNGTWAGYGDCKKPPPGFHGKFFLGKTKANLKFALNLGIVSFEPSVEIPIYDGVEFPIDF